MNRKCLKAENISYDSYLQCFQTPSCWNVDDDSAAIYKHCLDSECLTYQSECLDYRPHHTKHRKDGLFDGNYTDDSTYDSNTYYAKQQLGGHVAMAVFGGFFTVCEIVFLINNFDKIAKFLHV